MLFRSPGHSNPRGNSASGICGTLNDSRILMRRAQPAPCERQRASFERSGSHFHHVALVPTTLHYLTSIHGATGNGASRSLLGQVSAFWALIGAGVVQAQNARQNGPYLGFWGLFLRFFQNTKIATFWGSRLRLYFSSLSPPDRYNLLRGIRLPGRPGH